MNFDSERVLALAKMFDFPRAVNTPGEQRAADLVAVEFQRAGLRVERRTIREWPTPYILLPLLVVLLWMGITQASLRISLTVEFALAAIGMMGLISAFLINLRLSRISYSCPSEQIIGSQSHESPPARIVVFTRLGTIPGGLIYVGKHVVGILGMGLLVALFPTSDVRIDSLSPRVAIALLLGWWAASLLMLGLPENLGAAERSRRYRTNLAVLAELARSWPRAHGDRVEVLFVAMGGTWGGSADLSRLVRRDAGKRPTLIVNLDAPGLGPRLVLVGSKPGLTLANEAAKGLWLPYRVSRRRWESPLIGTFAGPGLAYVSVRGDQKSAPIDPAALNATAQLVIEMALRWAKQSRKSCENHPLDWHHGK